MTARDDYPVDTATEQYETMCDEIDSLRPVVAAAIAWADAEDESLTPGLQDSTDRLWDAVARFRGDPFYRRSPEQVWITDDNSDSFRDDESEAGAFAWWRSQQ